MDENHFTLRQPADLAQTVKCGSIDDRQTRRHLEAELVWKLDDRLLIDAPERVERGDVLEPWDIYDSIARPETGHPGADSRNDP